MALKISFKIPVKKLNISDTDIFSNMSKFKCLVKGYVIIKNIIV